jgi:cell division protein FtsL
VRVTSPKASAESKRCKKMGRIMEMFLIIVEAVVLYLSLKIYFYLY